MNQQYLENLRQEYNTLTSELSGNLPPAEIRKKARRHAELGLILEKSDLLNKTLSIIEENKKILKDPELKDLATEEIEKLETQKERLEAELKKMLIPKDPEDRGDAILEIRAGTGGEEAALFAAELLRMYTRFCENKKFKLNIDSVSQSDLAGIKEAIIEIRGDGAYGLLKFEAGVHRVQRVPETEKSGRVHTSTASVAVLPLLDEKEFEIDPKEITIETSTAQGPGGQSVNTTYSAIKATHVPTGITAKSQDQKSQHQNKDKALRVLRARVAAHYKEIKDREEREKRQSQIKGAERSDKIRTYNYPQDRITDHRLNVNFSQIETRLGGQIDDIVEQLQVLEEQEKMEQLEN